MSTENTSLGIDGFVENLRYLSQDDFARLARYLLAGLLSDQTIESLAVPLPDL